jgi:ABC-2 type transport system ATP-binding protein
VEDQQPSPPVEEQSSPLEIRSLSKRFGSILAVDDVNLTVQAGDVYGYLGPNGAGKTTTMRILLGLVHPDSGSVRLFGRDPVREGGPALEGVAGFVEMPTFYPYLSGRTNLRLLSALDQRGAVDEAMIDEVLDTVELSDRAGDRVGGYSQGMKQRLGIAAALLRRPRLLILDEPASGLDPAGIRDVRTLVGDLAERGITILYSSHLLAEVEEICNRVAIIDHGRVIFEGRLEDLRRTAGEILRLECADPVRAAAIAEKTGGIHDVQSYDSNVRFSAERPEAVEALTLALGQEGIGLRALVPERASLEELFFRLTEQGEAEK